ncbi:unnamed protein product, partial [Ectocarpus fasciculatus]
SAVALASARSELAGLLHEQGKLLEAEELYRSALDMRIAALGVEHPCVGLSASNLSGVLRDQGRRAEATSIMRASMNITASPPSLPQQQQQQRLRSASFGAAAAPSARGDAVGIMVTAKSTSSRATPNPPVATPPVGDLLLDDKAAPKNSPLDSLVPAGPSP